MQLESHRKEEGRMDAAAKEARERVAALRSDAGSQQQQSGLVAALMAAKSKGEVSGVYGRLGQSYDQSRLSGHGSGVHVSNHMACVWIVRVVSHVHMIWTTSPRVGSNMPLGATR